jgi:catalase
VKFHLRTQQGIQNLTNAEAAAIIGTDRESSQRDLFEAIERKEFPRWTMYVQIMTEEEAKTYRFDPFDLTKVWSHKDYPLIEVGYFELNRNPENYFAEVEQVAFNPANIVPGIGFSPDKMLQGRLFSYGDAQRYRLGVNHSQLPVNAPKCPFHHYQRDGQMQMGNYGSGFPHYSPNSYEDAPKASPEFMEPPLQLTGAASHYPQNEDYYTQAGDLFRLLPKDEQERMFQTLKGEFVGTEPHIVERMIRHFYKADPAYGEGVAKAVGMTIDFSVPQK